MLVANPLCWFSHGAAQILFVLPPKSVKVEHSPVEFFCSTDLFHLTECQICYQTTTVDNRRNKIGQNKQDVLCISVNAPAFEMSFS
jgi:hypothetical protein